MYLESMYEGIPFSPPTVLVGNIGANDTVIEVQDIAVFPAAPNFATIGTAEEGFAETIFYTAVAGNYLNGCVRGIEGLARTWLAGQIIARNWTNEDYKALINNIYELKKGINALEQANKVPIGNVSNLAITIGVAQLTISWSDPEDIIFEGNPLAVWGGTLLRRKNSPWTSTDNQDTGDLIVDNISRNAYAVSGYVDTGLTNGVTYFYKAFPYTTSGIYTNSAANEINGTPSESLITIYAVPSQSGVLTFNGSTQSPQWNDFDNSQLNIGGIASGINAAIYTATFSPRTGFIWWDGTSTAKNVEWTIGKAAGSLELSRTAIELNSDNLSDSFIVTRAGDGIISIQSSDESVVSVVLDGSTVIVNNVNQTTGTAVITVSVAEGTNHFAPVDEAVDVNAVFIVPQLRQFFAIPGQSGVVRLKIEMDPVMTSVMVRYKASPWIVGDTINTGTHVATLADDSNTSGDNQWLEVTGLEDGTEYFYKAFPASFGIINSDIGVNETKGIAGGLQAEWTGDSISGSTINDTSGNNRNITGINVTFVPGVVGNAINGNGNAQARLLSVSILNVANRSITAFIKFNLLGSSNQTLLDVDGHNAGLTASPGKMCRINYNGANQMIQILSGGSPSLTYNIRENVGDIYFISIINENGVSSLYVNGELKISGIAGSGITTESAPTILSLGINTNHANGWIDQLRVFNRALTDDEIKTLYNGGAGC
jgi:hypothetical protein